MIMFHINKAVNKWSLLASSSAASKIRLLASSSSNSTIVNRVRRQQIIKESDDECKKIIQDGKFMLYYRGKPFLYKSEDRRSYAPRLATYHQALDILPNLDQTCVFLRLLDDDHHHHDQPLFAVMLPKESDTDKVEKAFKGCFIDMRAAVFLVQSDWFGAMSGGSSLLRWLKSAKFCWSCQTPLKRNASGCQLKCANSACGAVFYPPTSPVGISLIASPDHSRALLIRQAVYPAGMYSCVAGFVDPGESLAECVAREAAEEAGVEVDMTSVQLVGSGHWPNPTGSLMMGCIVTTETENATPCSHEIEAVRWFTPSELGEAFATSVRDPGLRFAENTDPDVFFVPPKGAMANAIIQTWLKERHNIIF
jgi:NAD+ diphosphatase